MKIKHLIAISLMLFGAVSVDGQETKKEEREEFVEEALEQEKHVLTVSFAQTFVPRGANLDNIEEGHFVPGLGFDYFYRFNPKWELGLMVDWEFDRYVIPREQELVRDHAVIVALVGAYTVKPTWNMYLGGGYELEENKNLAVLRIGAEKVFPLKRNLWFIPVGAMLDLKEGYESVSLMVGIGRGFR